MTPEQIGQALTQAGWRLDGGFPEYPIVGRHDDDDDHASITARGELASLPVRWWGYRTGAEGSCR